MMKIYSPLDAAALSVGADRVARAIQAEADARKIDVQIIRTGSRGLLWLEPLVEAETASGRIGFGPVKPADVKGLFDIGFAGEHALRLGEVEAMPVFKLQQRFTFERVGRTDPLSMADFHAHGGGAGLRKALAMTPKDVVEEVAASGLRGRGGARVRAAPGGGRAHPGARRGAVGPAVGRGWIGNQGYGILLSGLSKKARNTVVGNTVTTKAVGKVSASSTRRG